MTRVTGQKIRQAILVPDVMSDIYPPEPLALFDADGNPVEIGGGGGSSGGGGGLAAPPFYTSNADFVYTGAGPVVIGTTFPDPQAGVYLSKIAVIWDAPDVTTGSATIWVDYLATDESELTMVSLTMTPDELLFDPAGNKLDMQVLPMPGWFILKAMQDTDQNTMSFSVEIWLTYLGA